MRCTEVAEAALETQFLFLAQDAPLIRPTTDADFDGIITLATRCGLFEPDQTELLAEMLRSRGDADTWFTDDADGVVVGVAYMAPEKMTDGTWNLYWIAVDPNHQRQCRGGAMLTHVEQWLADKGERLLIVETAGIDKFDYVRSFYAGHGFESDATIREFYEPGVDKVVFRKSQTQKSE